MPTYKIETVEAFKKLYSERKDTIDYLEKIGNKFERAQAMVIKEAAGCDFKGCSNVVQTQQPLETIFTRPTTRK